MRANERASANALVSFSVFSSAVPFCYNSLSLNIIVVTLIHLLSHTCPGISSTKFEFLLSFSPSFLIFGSKFPYRLKHPNNICTKKMDA
jgi:hypothetical protein